MIDQTASGPGSTDPITDELRVIKDRARKARLEYERQRGLYRDFANDITRLIKACLADSGISYHTITCREKNPDSFERKAAQTSPDDPSVAKYIDPLQEITDKAAVRVTTYFLETVDSVLKVLDREFDVRERLDKTSSDPDRIGYQSHHYLVCYPRSRTSLSEYRKFSGLIAEIQVRTILQHAWAEIEHDIQYRAIAAVPDPIRRRFTALAGLIEIADREFQAIANENLAIRAQASIDIDTGRLDQVEITRDALKEYLDKKFGTDGNIREIRYDYAVRMLLALGFTNLSEVDECISSYDANAVGWAICGTQLGQLSRFNWVLLAGMGEYYILAHPYFPGGFLKSNLGRIRQHGIEPGNYRPNAYPGTRTHVSISDI
jgi:ppGpp synthetase/RelA/SpoT-type nucleotidyltranferase